MKAKSLYIQKLAYDENTGNEIIGLFPSEANPAIVSSYTYDAKRMGGAPTLTATIYSSEPLQWKKEEFVEYNGDRFFASYTPNSTKDNSSRMWKSEITFTSRRELLDNTLFFDVVVDDVDTQNKDRYRSNQTKFTFGGTIHEFVARINSSMAYCGLYRPTDEHKGYYVVIDEGYGTDEVKEVSFEDQYLTDVLQLINTTFELDYYWDGNVCHVGKVQHDLTDTPIKYGSSDALISVSKENANYKIVDMITGYGSSDNLPYYYPNDDEFGEAVFNTENISKDKVSVELSKFLKDSRYNDNLILYKSKEGKSYNGSVDVSSHTFDRFTTPSNLTQADNQSNPTVTCRFSFSIPISAIKGQSVDLTNLNFISELNSSVSRKDYITNVGNAVKSIYIFKGKELYKTISNKTSFGSVATYTFEEDGDFTLSIESEFSYKCKVYKNSAGINDFYGADSWNAAFSGSIEFLYESKSEYEWKNGDKYIPYGDAGINVSEIGEANCIEYDYQFVKDGDRYGFNKVYTGTEDNAVKVIVTDRVWIAPSSVLMPSIYRNTKGAERFYYALNNTHKLPSGNGYYEFVNLYKKGNPHQGTVTFDGIKPTIKGIVNAEGQLFGEIADVAFDKEDSDVKDSDGKHIHNYFYIKLHKFNGDFGFDLFAHALASESAKINLIKSNGCPACSFVIECYWDSANNKCYNNVLTDGNGNLKSDSGKMNSKGDYILNDTYVEDNKSNQDSTKEELWICVQKDTSTLGIVMPNASAGFKPQKGDLFVITGIKPPKVLVTAAEKRLDDALVKHMSENNTDQFNYSVKFSRIFLQENPDFASKLNENAKLSIQIQGDSNSDGSLIGHEVFVSNYSVKVDNDELAEVEIELVNSLEVTKSDTKQIIDAVKGEAVKSLSSMVGGSNTNSFNASITDKMYLSKLNDDTAKGIITWEKVQKFLAGMDIGDNAGQWTREGILSVFKFLTNNFEQGLYGHGAQIDENGRMEAQSLRLRGSLEAPKFVFNEVSVTKAEQWNTNGYGTIESVDTINHTIKLKLEENDYGSLSVGDICRGIFADIENSYGSDTNNEGEMDDCGFTIHRGFFTTYFYVKKIITAEKGKFVFEYGKRSEGTPDPCAFMDFAQYGNFTDEQRQSSMYLCSRGRSYIEVLDGVNTWEIQAENRVTRYGWLGGLRVKKTDGTWENLKGNGLFAQNNVYLGGAVITLSQIKDLDSLKLDVAAYDVTMSQPAAVITVDDLGNVINGLWSVDEAGVKQYRISTAIFAHKGENLLLLEDEANEECTAGHYRVYAIGNGCDVKIENGAVFLTGIDKIKDGVAGSADDANFNYDDMRKISACSITIVVELEGKVTKNLEFPIRIHHDSLPFMVCDLSNENASVAWNTKTAKYIGLPIETKVSLMYQNTPWEISDLNVGAVNGLKSSISLQGKEKVVTIDADNITSDILEQITKIPITVVGVYAGVSYEYTKELTILRSADMIVYDVVPSVDNVVVDKDGNLNTKSVSCKVYATSSDDKRYELSALPSGYQLKYGYGDTADTALALGGSATASTDHTRITFALYDNKGALLDLETVPIVSFGKDGKGIEYIFKRTTDSTPPKNPTPSDWSTNAEYLRTDKEYIPSGWTDDPSGVDAVNLYEWVSKRVSTNGHWGAFSDPAEYAHFGKHAAKATLSDYIVTIPTDSDGNALAAFAEDVFCSLVVDGKLCSGISISADNTPAGVTLGNSLLRISYSKGYALGATSKVIKVKVSGKLDNATYSDTITLTILPNISGADGDGYEYVFYLSNSATAPSKPSRYNGKLSSNWVDDPPSPTDDNRYVYVSYYEGKVGAPNVSQGLWSSPALWAYKAPKGDPGKQGVGNVTSITISDWTESAWNNAGTYGTVRSFGSDTSSKRNGCRVDDLFTVVGTATDTKNSHTITYKSLTDSGVLKGTCLSHTVAYRGEQGGPGGSGPTGPRGTKGPIQRTHDGFETGSYDYSDGTKDTDKFIDVVVVDGRVYYCIKSYRSSSPSVNDTEHWAQGSNFDLVATKLLLAENATIKMANSQQINIEAGGNIWGSFRYAATDDDYALWLGAPDGASAPFSVKRSGFAKMTDADITGKITATSGQIAGMKISGLGLTNAGFDNDAYIILRNDSYNTFAGIGYHVAAYESGVNAVAHFSNGETKDSGEKNYAMVVNAYGADDNIAIGISGGYIEGLRVKTGMLTAGGASSNSPVKILKGIHSIMVTGAGYYQLPAMEKNDDGYVLFVKNEYDGSINIVTSSGINRKGEKKDTFILFDRGDKTTNLTVDSRGDAMVFVYHRDVVQEGYNFRGGCWVQYKCPRDW